MRISDDIFNSVPFETYKQSYDKEEKYIEDLTPWVQSRISRLNTSSLNTCWYIHINSSHNVLTCIPTIHTWPKCQEAVREVQAANSIIESDMRRWGPKICRTVFRKNRPENHSGFATILVLMELYHLRGWALFPGTCRKHVTCYNIPNWDFQHLSMKGRCWNFTDTIMAWDG